MTTHTERKETRLVARTTTEIQEIIQRAADYSGATLSQFLIESALENPPKANDKLLKAAQHYSDTISVHTD